MAGVLFRIDAGGTADLLMDTNQRSAAIGAINDESMVLMPTMLDKRVLQSPLAEQTSNEKTNKFSLYAKPVIHTLH